MSVEDDEQKQRKPGLRFEVYPVGSEAYVAYWQWRLVGKDGVVCISAETFDNETMARSDIAKNKGRMKASGYAKVITIDTEE